MKFEVTDSTRAILPVRKGADSGAMTVFKSYGGGKDLQKNMNILDKIKGFHTVYERGVAVFDVRSSGVGRDHPEIAVPFFEITDWSEPYVRLRRMRRTVQWESISQHELHSHTDLQHERVKKMSWYTADTDHGARCVFVR